MDDGGQSLNTLSFNGTQQQQHRRRLTKRPPPSSYHHASSTSFDGRAVDTQSLQSKRSSTSLRRAPSAPQTRTSFSAYASSSNSSSPRHQPSTGAPSLSNPSPILTGSEFLTNDYQQYKHQLQAQKQQQQQLQQQPYLFSSFSKPQYTYQHSASIAAAASAAASAPSANRMNYNVSDSSVRTPSYGSALTSTSEDFVGAPFDGAAILNRIEETATPVQQPQPHSLQPSYHPPAPPTSHPNPSQAAKAGNMQAAAFSSSASAAMPSGSATDYKPAITAVTTTSIVSAPVTAAASPTPSNEISEKTPSAPQAGGSRPSGSTTGSDSPFPGAKRFSDETKEFRAPGMLRKKSGFSGFMTSLVGSPKKPLISAPENPVHLTHVGYDSSTGQFTVCPCNDQDSSFPLIIYSLLTNNSKPLDAIYFLFFFLMLQQSLTCKTGLAKGLAAVDQRERHNRKGAHTKPRSSRAGHHFLQGDDRKSAGGPGLGKVPRRAPRHAFTIVVIIHNLVNSVTKRCRWLCANVASHQPSCEPSLPSCQLRRQLREPTLSASSSQGFCHERYQLDAQQTCTPAASQPPVPGRSQGLGHWHVSSARRRIQSDADYASGAQGQRPYASRGAPLKIQLSRNSPLRNARREHGQRAGDCYCASRCISAAASSTATGPGYCAGAGRYEWAARTDHQHTPAAAETATATTATTTTAAASILRPADATTVPSPPVRSLARCQRCRPIPAATAVPGWCHDTAAAAAATPTAAGAGSSAPAPACEHCHRYRYHNTPAANLLRRRPSSRVPQLQQDRPGCIWWRVHWFRAWQ